MNIYQKLTLFCAFLVLASSLAIYLTVDAKVKNVLKEEIISELSQQTHSSINNIDRFIYQRMSDLRTFAKVPTFRTSAKNPDGYELTQRLLELHQANEMYYSLSFFDMNRLRLADSKGFSVGSVHGDQSYWKRINPGTDVIMDISKSESIGKVVMHFAAVVRDFRNKPIGVLVARVLIDRLYEVINDFSEDGDFSLDQRFKIDLVDHNGTILYSSYDEDAVLKKKYDNEFVLSKFNIRTDKERLNLETDESLYFVTPEPGYLNFNGNGWVLITRLSKNYALSSMNDIRVGIALIILPVVVLSIVLALFIASVISRPIMNLSKAAKEIERGNLQVKIESNSKDEIGILARQLQDTSQNLISKIEEQKRLNQQLQKQKEEIENKNLQIEEQSEKINFAYREIQVINSQITDSIRYAQKIQSAMLPEMEILREAYPESFVFYQPKDIISGDFYYFGKMESIGTDYFVIIAGDCTGHGVPGAIMTMLGSNSIHNVISEHTYEDPSDILNKIHQDVKSILKQTDNTSSFEAMDGMELSICMIDMSSKVMRCSGVGLPIIHFNSQGEGQVFKGNRFMLGSSLHHKGNGQGHAFDTYEVNLKPGDTIYLFSDGFQDQFGGEFDKRYKNKNFRNLLSDNLSLTMSEQANIVESEFLKWKGDLPQTDDILVMGFRV